MGKDIGKKKIRGGIKMNKQKNLVDFVNHNQFELQTYLTYLIGHQAQTDDNVIDYKKRGEVILMG